MGSLRTSEPQPLPSGRRARMSRETQGQIPVSATSVLTALATSLGCPGGCGRCCGARRPLLATHGIAPHPGPPSPQPGRLFLSQPLVTQNRKRVFGGPSGSASWAFPNIFIFCDSFSNKISPQALIANPNTYKVTQPRDPQISGSSTSPGAAC